jgi:hypothetical protein
MGKLSPGSDQIARLNIEIMALEDYVRSYRLVRAHESSRVCEPARHRKRNVSSLAIDVATVRNASERTENT